MIFEMNLAGRWAYNTYNKVLTMQGTASLGNSNIFGGYNNSMNIFGGLGNLMNTFGGFQIPPIPLNISLRVGSKAGNGRYYVTDLTQGGSGFLIKQ